MKDAFHLDPFPALGEWEETWVQMQSCAAALQAFAGKFGGCFARWRGVLQGVGAAPVPRKSWPEGLMSAL